jgi:hypothetical protein
MGFEARLGFVLSTGTRICVEPVARWYADVGTRDFAGYLLAEKLQPGKFGSPSEWVPCLRRGECPGLCCEIDVTGSVAAILTWERKLQDGLYGLESDDRDMTGRGSDKDAPIVSPHSLSENPQFLAG